MSFADPTLQSILDAELAAGNEIAGQSCDASGRPLIRLRRPFSADYVRTQQLQGIFHFDDFDPRGDYGDEYYANDEELLAAAYDHAVVTQRTQEAIERGHTTPSKLPPPPPEFFQPRMRRQTLDRAVLRLTKRLEEALRAINGWRDQPPPPERMNFKRAFAGDTLPLEQWIQFVMIPRAREMAEKGGDYPPDSHVSAYATREWDGQDNMDGVLRVLRIFDELFAPRHRYIGGGRAVDYRSLWRGLPALLVMSVWVVCCFVGVEYFAPYFSSFAKQPVAQQFTIGTPPSGAWGLLDIAATGNAANNGRLQMTDVRIAVARKTHTGPFKLTMPLVIDVTDDSMPAKVGAQPARPLTSEVLQAWLREDGADAKAADFTTDCDATVEFVRAIARAGNIAELTASALRAGNGALQLSISGPPFVGQAHIPEQTRLTVAGLLCIVGIVPGALWLRRIIRRNRYAS